MKKEQKNNIKEALNGKLSRYFGTTPKEATADQLYKAVVYTVRDLLAQQYQVFKSEVKQKQAKTVYYLCMEFLMGRSLRNNLMSLDLEEEYGNIVKSYGFDLQELYDFEPDPGLGNGGLGRLAACFMDSLAFQGYPARGYSICYEYGIFKQRIIDGEQVELPDVWLPGGEAWLIPRQDKAISVKFGGKIKETWTEDGHHKVLHEDYDEVEAVPYDMLIPGDKGESVVSLRLWRARDTRNFNMDLFSQGQYVKAVEENTLAETISKVLYPSDNHHEGKLLRLSQQYFLVAASLHNIIDNHLAQYKTLRNLHEKAAIHINDTHPALVIPELMRIMLDEHNYSWEDAWYITTNAVSYTNHTIMPEALETWNEELFKYKLPRHHTIIKEINERFCRDAWNLHPGNWDKACKLSIIEQGMIKMANLSVVGSHKVNGVSKLHSNILANIVFKDFSNMYPDKFTNVTNGITYRRWLVNSNPLLAKLLDDTIGTAYRKDSNELLKLLDHKDDKNVLFALEKIKRQNKVAFADRMYKTRGLRIDPESIFDVQVKRIHEYKRQLMNAIHIISLYQKLKENPNLNIRPKTFIFGGKAASGYYIAKDIVRLISHLSIEIERHPEIRSKLRVIFLENYNVSLAEDLIPAAEISQQISLAGKEASGTGNMKFMINGAVTIGTADGANIEIAEAVGEDNIFIFGNKADEVEELWRKGYSSAFYYNRDEDLKKAIDSLQAGFAGRSFDDIANYLLYSFGVSDPFMCLADFAYYRDTHASLIDAYEDRYGWNQKTLMNIANAGIFSSDRSIRDYAEKIWHIKPLDETK